MLAFVSSGVIRAGMFSETAGLSLEEVKMVFRNALVLRIAKGCDIPRLRSDLEKGEKEFVV